MTERRKFMRFKALLDVLYNALGNQPKKSKCQLKDFSREGLRMSSEDSLERGSLLELEMQIPGDNLPVYAFGEVAWSERMNESSFDSGVKITKIERFDRARLLDYVYNEWIKSKKEDKQI